ncbi:MAG: hypothetical protein CMJ24_07920 [Phycisphaerae bacterium]|nr:hypothetical protein [Phycisphaerae bacterium]
MRGRRGARGAAFSLFAFQDILTTTIGVVLLILLVLALNISFTTITDVVSKSQDQHPLSAMDEDQLARQIELKSRILGSIDSSNSVKEELAQLDKETRQFLDELESLLEATQLDAQQAAQQASQAMSELESLDAQLAAKWDELAQLADAAKLEAAESEEMEELKRLRGEQGRLEAELNGALANNSLVYIKQQGGKKKPLLVEITRDTILVHSKGISEGMPMIELSHVDIDERCESAVELIRQLCADEKSYPLLVVSPEGGEPVDTGYQECPLAFSSPGSKLEILLRKQGFNIGVYPIEAGIHTADKPLLPEGVAP